MCADKTESGGEMLIHTVQNACIKGQAEINRAPLREGESTEQKSPVPEHINNIYVDSRCKKPQGSMYNSDSYI